MIQLCTAQNAFTLPHNWQGTYCANRLKAYGIQADFAPFYKDENDGFLSILDGNGILCGTSIVLEEWATFISMHPAIKTVCMAFSQAEEIGSLLHREVSEKSIMRLQTTLPTPEIPLIQPSPREMYPLLSAVFGDTMPPFETWYVDISHKIRHGLCHTIGVQDNGKLVSCAMTVALTDTIAVIGAVATAETHRKRGYAAQCLRGLTQNVRTIKPDTEILISPKNDGAKRLYTALGFTVCDTIGCIEL